MYTHTHVCVCMCVCMCVCVCVCVCTLVVQALGNNPRINGFSGTAVSTGIAARTAFMRAVSSAGMVVYSVDFVSE